MIRPRFADLRTVHRRLRQARNTDEALRSLAEAAREQARTLADLAGPLHCCAGCARHTDPPHGHYDGGFCCGGDTFELFCTDELAALAAVGTSARQLAAKHRTQAGCVFRGPEGCSLSADARPTICIGYFCNEAMRELHQAGKLAEIGVAVDELKRLFNAFKARRQQLELDALWAGAG